MLHELLNITVDNHVTFPSYFINAFVDMLEIFAQESALFTKNKKLLLKTFLKNFAKI